MDLRDMLRSMQLVRTVERIHVPSVDIMRGNLEREKAAAAN